MRGCVSCVSYDPPQLHVPVPPARRTAGRMHRRQYYRIAHSILTSKLSLDGQTHTSYCPIRTRDVKASSVNVKAKAADPRPVPAPYTVHTQDQAGQGHVTKAKAKLTLDLL